jgi:deoxyribodipyrimidine photo-lyase
MMECQAQLKADEHRFEPTRAAGLLRLQAFVPMAGRAYAARRNFDYGPGVAFGAAQGVSGLSPYIRRRLITEREVVAAVLTQNTPEAAQKFIQEVLWRSYWKGWLEMRPGLLSRFDQERSALKRSMENDARFARASSGQTGIGCFDAWVRELQTTGWLHNHTRMYFASIWIFTLALPWQLGADFFYKHLLDADPASNTLSWRWVAGLHTPGKHYLARAENICTYTNGRFNPIGQLLESAPPLALDAPVECVAIPACHSIQKAHVRRALLISDEDLYPESYDLAFAAIAQLDSAQVAAPNSPAAAFNAGARTDAQLRASAFFGVHAAVIDAANVLPWAKLHNVEEVVTAYAPVGMIAWALGQIERELTSAGIRLVRIRRDWDTQTWPHASAGFFKLKAQIPTLLARLCYTGFAPLDVCDP